MDRERLGAAPPAPDRNEGRHAHVDEVRIDGSRQLARARGGAATTGARRDKGSAAAAQ